MAIIVKYGQFLCKAKIFLLACMLVIDASAGEVFVLERKSQIPMPNIINGDMERTVQIRSLCRKAGISDEICKNEFLGNAKFAPVTVVAYHKSALVEAKIALLKKGHDMGWLNAEGEFLYEAAKPRLTKPWRPTHESKKFGESNAYGCGLDDDGMNFREYTIKNACAEYRVGALECRKNFIDNRDFYEGRYFDSEASLNVEAEIENWAQANGLKPDVPRLLGE